MIKSITSLSRHVITNHTPPSYIGNYGMSAGTMRYNSSSAVIEVYDGSHWQQLQGFSAVGLTAEAEAAIEWANKKRLEEIEFNKKLEKYPTLKHAYEQFKMIEALVYEEEIAN